MDIPVEWCSWVLKDWWNFRSRYIPAQCHHFLCVILVGALEALTICILHQKSSVIKFTFKINAVPVQSYTQKHVHICRYLHTTEKCPTAWMKLCRWKGEAIGRNWFVVGFCGTKQKTQVWQRCWWRTNTCFFSFSSSQNMEDMGQKPHSTTPSRVLENTLYLVVNEWVAFASMWKYYNIVLETPRWGLWGLSLWESPWRWKQLVSLRILYTNLATPRTILWRAHHNDGHHNATTHQ